MPSIISTIEDIFRRLTGSLNHIKPIIAVSAVPTPAQIAYVTPISSFLNTKVRKTRQAPKNRNAKTDGSNFENPSAYFIHTVPITSQTIPKKRYIQ